MPKKYHIETKTIPLDIDYIFKFKITRGENCINCGKCTKVCIYEAHKRRKDDPRKMADPNTVVCRNCFRCIQECPRGALEKSLSKEYLATGGPYWKPDILISLWKQAEDGKVPVSGAGYRGPFSGPGFDSMWTDMSEIVRPTRDGIHGREYINTAVELGRKLNHLSFTSDGKLEKAIPDTVMISLPVLFDFADGKLNPMVREALLKAAGQINTAVLLPAAEITANDNKYAGHIIPCLGYEEIESRKELLKSSQLVAVRYMPQMLTDLPAMLAKIKTHTKAVTIIRLPAVKEIENIVTGLVRKGAEAIHIVADPCGQEQNGKEKGRYLKDIIRSVHLKLVDEGIRDEATIIASGGIALAEQVTKAMLCGADLTAIDIPLLVALGWRIYEKPGEAVSLAAPESLDKVSIDTMTHRIVNLVGAWHSQILEMMGAMGIREARRLRGESGRAIFFEEIDKSTFGRIFSNEKR
jgi:ferredoxin